MPDWLKEWWPVVAIAFPAIVTVLGWAVRTGLASRKDLDAAIAKEAAARAAQAEKMGVELREIDLRTRETAQEIKHLPSRKDIEGLKDQLSHAVALGESTTRELASVSRALTRVEDHLFKSAP
ncbi:Uncharacterised protein [Starkeya nomas]|uniref:DUF2730 family protein n=1 Tax=Starkeya nomas TaxID=2666134 RepID=A0A5S9R6Q4_9HYPH|nr:hypothetical protein [Starkeya nomas]CAA0129558.1 Uncharacterised protein [Starkeya nomas]